MQKTHNIYLFIYLGKQEIVTYKMGKHFTITPSVVLVRLQTFTFTQCLVVVYLSIDLKAK